MRMLLLAGFGSVLLGTCNVSAAVPKVAVTCALDKVDKRVLNDVANEIRHNNVTPIRTVEISIELSIMNCLPKMEVNGVRGLVMREYTYSAVIARAAQSILKMSDGDLLLVKKFISDEKVKQKDYSYVRGHHLKFIRTYFLTAGLQFEVSEGTLDAFDQMIPALVEMQDYQLKWDAL